MTPVGILLRQFLAVAVALIATTAGGGMTYANPYLAKPGEPAAKVRIGTCAVTGGFIHNRRMIVPAKLVAETLDIARDEGMKIRRKPSEVFDNSFVERLETSGFMKELWGGAPEERRQ